MIEQSLNEFYNELVQVLIDDVGYYIPSEIIPEHLVNQVYSIGSYGFFDEMLVLDPEKGLLVFEAEEFNLKLFDKHTLLEKNLFKLLRKKSGIELDEFNYILDKYFRQVEFYFSITNWLNVHLELYNSDKIDIDISGSFQLQYSYYKKHFEDLIDQFYVGKEIFLKEIYPIDELMENHFPDLLARYSLASANSIKKEEAEITEEYICKTEEVELKSKKSNIKKKIKVYITENEADEFVLKSVFNISGLNSTN